MALIEQLITDLYDQLKSDYSELEFKNIHDLASKIGCTCDLDLP